MKRQFHIHLSDKDLEKLNNDMKEGKPFMHIDGTNIHDLGFEIEPIEEYEAPKGFPNCCPFHESIKRNAEDWYIKFPDCCKTHKKLKKKTWFKKEDYKDRPEKVLNAVNYTEHQIGVKIEEENWYKEITDYIEYCEHSFGTPSVGAHLYERGVKHFIKHCKTSEYDFSKEKRNRLNEYFKVKGKPKKEKDTDLNLLFSVFQKWVKSFPKLFFFDKLRERLEGKIPINLILYEREYNPYLGTVKSKVKTKGELIELLTKTTKQLLLRIDSTQLVKDEVIKDVKEHQLNLINENHLFRQESLLKDYSKGEKKYIKAIKKWLENEKKYFQEIKPFFEESNSKLIEDSLKEIKEAIGNIESELGEFKFLISNLSIEQKEGISSVLSNLESIDETLFKADWNNSEFQLKLDEIINSMKLQKEEKEKIKTELKDESPDIAVKHKLKFIIPLLFFKYEGEIELSEKQKFPKNWKQVKKLLLKEKK